MKPKPNEELEALQSFMTKKSEGVSSQTKFLRNFLVGGFSAAVAVTIMAPIERSKLILQVQNASSNVKPEFHYKGLRDCLVRIPREQGFQSFWRGNYASVLRSFPYQAFNFAFRDKYKDFFVRGYEKKNHFWRRLGGNLLTGGIAGASAMTIIYPLDYARTRLAMDQGVYKHTREFRSMSSCIRETYRIDGLVGLYRGFYFSIFGVFIYRAGFFGIYDTGRDFTPDEYKHMIAVSFGTAELAATTSGLLSYPMDTVRRSMMMQSARVSQKKHYENSIDCIRKLYKKSGVRGFYNGALTNVLRGTGGALILVLYSEIHHRLWGHLGEGPDPEQLKKRRPPESGRGGSGSISKATKHNIEGASSPMTVATGTDTGDDEFDIDKEFCPTTTRSYEDHVFHFCDF